MPKEHPTPMFPYPKPLPQTQPSSQFLPTLFQLYPAEYPSYTRHLPPSFTALLFHSLVHVLPTITHGHQLSYPEDMLGEYRADAPQLAQPVVLSNNILISDRITTHWMGKLKMLDILHVGV